MSTTRVRPRGRVITLAIACLTLVTLLAAPTAVSAAPPPGAAYAQTVTLPVPPASSFAGNSGGDGWDISLDATRVYNVYHHNPNVYLACQEQADASKCGPLYPKIVRDELNRSFHTANQSATELDPATGRLYTWGRRSDGTGGVVCIDTTVADADPDVFCGFTALTGAGEVSNGWYAISGQSRIGDRWFSMVHSGPANSTAMCFDLSTIAPCAGQPFASATTGVTVGGSGYSTSAIGDRWFVQDGSQLECIDTTTMTACAGAWPASTAASLAAPFPLLDGAGTPVGVCVPNGSRNCFDLGGTPVATPPGMVAAIPTGTLWNGASVVIGTRVYVPAGGADRIGCYDYGTSAVCPGFPVQLANKYLYSVNTDPFRPACLWVNGDYGNQQVENFDAFGGGPCGEGDIRVLVSQFVVDEAACFPAAYDTLSLLDPTPAEYTSASVAFQDSGGNPTGIPDQAFVAGDVDLTGLGLEAQPALPQFLIELTDPPASLGAVTVRLTWNADYDPTCTGPATEIDPEPTDVGMTVSSNGSTGPSVSAPSGSSATANAALSGVNAGGAIGTVSYTWFDDAGCTSAASTGAPLDITIPGVLPASAPVSLPDGTYRVVASYSGDIANDASSVACADAAVLTLGSVVGPTFVCDATATVAGALAAGLNVIEGTSAGDTLLGTAGPDVIFGYGGHDDLRGRGGDDCILGGAGNDFAAGGGGADTILGQGGSDKLDGNGGADTLHGGGGSFSMIDGGNGVDTCVSTSPRERHTRCES